MVQKFLTQLENLAFKFQYRYMKPKITRERVGRHYAFFHPRPTGKIILEEYKKRLQGRTLKDKSAKGSDPKGKVILVTGVFDILHSEHKKFLRAAKNLGGRLLVGVETDARVRVLKGSGRPVNPLAMRLRQLCQLKIADEVFALPEKFATEADRLAWLKKLQPDILAVSASDPNLPAKRKLMSCVGGRVIVVLPHNPKISTTKMLE
ncbi:MAG: Bifunctional protein HldE [Microgenomates group bacterium GW2011_GWC2_45_8]|nr:MAG: Bifunctional protein HldE [Microgenomates group bacterium GW2011_GWC2_45_8]